MPKEIQRIHFRGEPLKYLNGESVDDILATVDQFIEGVYHDLSLTPPHRATLSNSNSSQTRRSLNESSSPNSSPVGATSMSVLSSGNENCNVSPSTRMNMDVEIERINRMCDTVDENLRSVGVFMYNFANSSNSEDRLNTNIPSLPSSSTNFMSDLNPESSPQSTTVTSFSETRTPSRSEPTAAEPTQIIDLSETQPQTSSILENNNNNCDDDDVILVSGNITPVVDLCTPGGENETSRRRRLEIDHSDLNRRRLPVPDVLVVENQSTARRRRFENRRKSLGTSITEAENYKNENNSPSAGNTASGRLPYMCSVCMESCLQRQPTSTKCGHIFCKECISQAIHISRKCPLCNTKMSKNHLFRIYP